MPKRRNVMLGLGALAFGSGAVSVNAAFNENVSPSADMQVIAAADVRVRRGANVPSDDSVNTVNGVDILNLDQITDSRVSGSSLDFGNLTGSDIPVAAVNEEENGDLTIETATAIRPTSGSSVTIEELVEITNEGDETIGDIGISYTGGYGADATSNDLSEDIVRDIYQFYAQQDGVSNLTSDKRISPVPNSGSDDPDNTFDLASGETVQLNLENNNHSYTSELRSASSVSGNPWDGVYDPINLLNTITVGSGWSQ